MSDKKGANKRKKNIVLGRVKELRETLGETQAKFAENIAVSPNTISRIERGEMSLSSDIALKIAEYYEISLDWLFDRSEDMYMLSPAHQASIKEAFDCIEEHNQMPKLKLNKTKKVTADTDK